MELATMELDMKNCSNRSITYCLHTEITILVI
nr:MAG TPA: hypothetical protein [Caudoviricetes sp.]